MFEKSLADVIRGIRANKNKEHDFITSSLNEARNEIKREDMDVKAKALQKVLYLSMLGYEMTWASFHVVEVMSASKFQHKRLGYLAAASSLQPDSEVLLLCVNLIKKDLASNSPYDVSLALSGLAAIINTDLARSLLPDLMAMMNHSRPYVRKRVTLLMYKVFLKYPDSLKQAFPRLREKLEDEDSGVVSAAVNVVCELANTNPKNYILLAPQLYTILTTSSNNWMLIKIVKLFGLLTPEEPRLARKLVGPLTNLINSTRAMSLLYECIDTVFTGGFLSPEVVGTLGNEVNQLATLCVTKLRGFVEDQDPNLKYLGLFLLLKLLPVNPKAVSEYRETILGCLDDPDVSIRLRALEIVTNIVTQKNIQDLVRRLLVHLMPRAPTNHKPVAAGKIRPPPVLDANYRMEVVRRILHLCTQESYEMVTDFEWYADVLVDLVRFSGVSVGEDLAEKLVDLAVRVKGVRGYLVGTMSNLLTDTKLFESYGSAASNLPVLRAAAWICGEYPSFLTSPEETLLALCSPININALTPITKQLYLQAGLKVFCFWAGGLHSRSITVGNWDRVIVSLRNGLKQWESATEELEACERLAIFHAIVDVVSPAPIAAPAESIFQPSPILGVLPILTAGELNPVARNAQRRVPIPEGLSLDQPIVERPKAQLGADSLLVDFDSDLHEIGATRKGKAGKGRKIKVKTEKEEKPEQQAERIRARELQRKADPFYIGPGQSTGGANEGTGGSPLSHDDLSHIPVVQLDIDIQNLGALKVEPNQPRSLARAKSRKPNAQNLSNELLTPVHVTRQEESPDVPQDAAREATSSQKKSKKKLTTEQMTLGGVSLTEDDLTFPDSSQRPIRDDNVQPAALTQKASSLKSSTAEGIDSGEGAKIKKKKKKTRLAVIEDPIASKQSTGGEYERISTPSSSETPLTAEGSPKRLPLYQ